MKSEAIIAYGAPLESVTKETPTPQGTAVLLKVAHCGVCHSDVHLNDGYFDLGGGNKMDLSSGRELPFILGHEIQGHVVSWGPDAQRAVESTAPGLEAGQKRIAYPWIGCGECSTCGRGEEHLCGSPRQLGVNVDGGFADHVLVPHPRYLLAYDGIDDALAGSYMCSGLTAFGALKKAGPIGAGDTLAIIGLGGVGMMALEFAQALFPQAHIVGADIDEAKLAAAKERGARAVYNSATPKSAKQVMKDSGGGAVAAIDFVGAEPSLAFATRIIRKGGRAVIVGLFGGGFAMPIPMFPLRAISLSGSYVGSLAETKEMLELVKAGKVAPIPIEKRPLHQANRSLDDLRNGRVVGRVVLTP